jgi:hypothetical protein
VKIIEDVEEFLASIPEGLKALYPKAQKLIAEIKEARSTEDELSQARGDWEATIEAGDMAIDTGAITSRDNNGRAMWVQAWVHLDESEESESDGDDEEEDDEDDEEEED